jgi:hypothetical protein
MDENVPAVVLVDGEEAGLEVVEAFSNQAGLYFWQRYSYQRRFYLLRRA